ncbi:MAG: ABC transporter permease [Gammaproteobacteria bacterium]|nr:ABC transporter permease [Pseudomonadales bacterium]
MIFATSDWKYTFRQIARSPGFALLSIIVLAGGLGLTLFTFSFIYTFGFKDVDLPNGDRIVELCGRGELGACMPMKAYEFAAIRDDLTTLENIGVYSAYQAYVQSDEVLYEAAITQTEWNMFNFLPERPTLGRTLQQADQRAAAEPVAVLSHGFWQLAFAGDPDILDSIIRVGGISRRVVGVMPEGFTFPRWSDLWIPAAQSHLNPVTNEMTLVQPYALRKTGATEDEASNEFANLLRRIRTQYPLQNPDSVSRIERIVSSLDSGFVTTLPRRNLHNLGNQLVFGIIGILAVILFLLACINVGTLLLARTNGRLRDMSIRVALGAPRIRLLVQTLGESIIIATAGALFAILMAGLFLQALNLFLTTLLAEEGIEFWWDFRIDIFTLSLAVVFALLTVLVTSAWPAWRLINGNFNSVMQDGTRGALGLKTGRFSRALVVAAIALISIFLYVFIAMITFVWSLGGTFRSIDPEGIYSLEVYTLDEFASARQRLVFFQSLQDRLASHPDVNEVMMIGEAGQRLLGVDDASYLTQQDRPLSRVQIYSGNLSMLNASLLEGRLFDDRDRPESTPVALVSQSLAQELWPGQSPVGRRLSVADSGEADTFLNYTVVGMTTDTPIDSTELFRREFNMVYLPLGQLDSEQITAIIRSNVNEQRATRILGDTVLGLNSNVSIGILSWAQNREMVSFVTRSGILVFTVIGLFAFLISIAGIFGLTKNSVQLRTQEIGTRRALGEPDRSISLTFIRQGIRQALIGIAIAILVCSPFVIFIESLAGPDFIVPGLIASAFVLLAFLACIILTIYYPIKNELQKEPAELLRYE